MSWDINQTTKKIPKLRNPVLIEGLPGIGNVGKLAVDFLIEELEGVEAYDFFSYAFPHSVFVNEDNLVELPSVTLYYAKIKGAKRDLLLLTGDVQPIDEISCYEFSDTVLDLAETHKTSEVITLGGIGLPTLPNTPKVFITGNNEKTIKFYKKKTEADNNLFGIIGPIVGVSGLLIGLAGRRGINAVTMLAETYGHPMYLGVKGAREILEILDNKLELGLDLSKMDEEIMEMDSDMLKKTKELSQVTAQPGMHSVPGDVGGKETNYIG